GHGSSTILMAQAFPHSTFYGFDMHAPSIVIAEAGAQADGVATNTRFLTTAADQIEGVFDLICLFDALHDMGDPVGVARHLRKCLSADGVLMLVEPLAGDTLTDNLHL